MLVRSLTLLCTELLRRLLLLKLKLTSLWGAKLRPRLSHAELVLILLLNAGVPAKLAVRNWGVGWEGWLPTLLAQTWLIPWRV